MFNVLLWACLLYVVRMLKYAIFYPSSYFPTSKDISYIDRKVFPRRMRTQGLAIPNQIPEQTKYHPASNFIPIGNRTESLAVSSHMLVKAIRLQARNIFPGRVETPRFDVPSHK